MRRVKQFIIQKLLDDATINGYVGRRVYPSQRDITPEILPAITVTQVSGGHRTVPSRARDMLMQVDIWSINNFLEVENIYERVTTLLNSPVTATSVLALTGDNEQIYWVREDSSVDVPDETRNLFHKAVTLRVWARA